MNPLISGWDFNVAPYMSELEFQFDFTNKKIYVLEENIGKPEEKENNTPKLAIKNTREASFQTAFRRNNRNRRPFWCCKKHKPKRGSITILL